MDKEVTAEQIQALLDEGKTKTEIGEQYGISAQKVGTILAAANKALAEKDEKPLTGTDIITDGEKPASLFAKTYDAGDVTTHKGITILTATEYAEYSTANGRVMGRKKGQKTKCTIEELRALINSKWNPKQIMAKHGMDAEDFKQLVWKLSERELRDRPLKFDISQDFIERG
jgi:hypothetical protein